MTGVQLEIPSTNECECGCLALGWFGVCMGGLLVGEVSLGNIVRVICGEWDGDGVVQDAMGGRGGRVDVEVGYMR